MNIEMHHDQRARIDLRLRVLLRTSKKRFGVVHVDYQSENFAAQVNAGHVLRNAQLRGKAGALINASAKRISMQWDAVRSVHAPSKDNSGSSEA